jgi:formylglycine-generating enzyme required for sulfatase activity
MLFAACDLGLTPPTGGETGGADGKVLVSVSILGAASRTVLPQYDAADISRYELRGAKTGEAETALLSFTTTSGAAVRLGTGTWNFTLNAYKGDDVYMQGKIENRAIAASGDTLAFALLPLNSGQGAIHITVTFPADAGIVSAAAITDGDTGNAEALTMSATSAEYSKSPVDAGDYFVSIRLKDSGGMVRAVVSELVVVRGNVTSGKTIGLAEGDLKPGVIVPEGFVYIPDATVTGSGSEGVFVSGRTVTVDSFVMAEYETTYELWYEVRVWAEEHGYTFVHQGREAAYGTEGAAPTTEKDKPVMYVSWYDIIVWCNAYSEKSGREPVYTYQDAVIRSATDTTVCDNAVMDKTKSGFRLPTEVEWEFAARGGNPSDTTSWNYTYAGSNTAGDVAWYGDNSGSTTHPVGTKAANSVGLFDMSGNVYEWCWDRYGSVSGSTPADGVSSGADRVNRGGSWDSYDQNLHPAFRGYYTPSEGINGVGFRLLCPPGSFDAETTPVPPAGVMVAAGDGQLVVSWDAAEGATAYEVWYWTTNDSAVANKYGSDVAGLTATISGLTNGTTYYVWVKAKNSAGTSGFSPSVSGIPYVPAVPENFVTLPGATVTGSGSEGVFVSGRTVTVDSFAMAKYETTYELWYEVRMWAEANGYTFNQGQEGYDGTTGAAPTTAKNEPVTSVSWRDVIVWCNAYSEKENRQPAYTYQGSVIKSSSDGTACDNAEMDKTKSGFRLPTEVEWEFAARGGNPSNTTNWGYNYAGNRSRGYGAQIYQSRALDTIDKIE